MYKYCNFKTFKFCLYSFQQKNMLFFDTFLSVLIFIFLNFMDLLWLFCCEQNIFPQTQTLCLNMVFIWYNSIYNNNLIVFVLFKTLKNYVLKYTNDWKLMWKLPIKLLIKLQALWSCLVCHILCPLTFTTIKIPLRHCCLIRSLNEWTLETLSRRRQGTESLL